MKTFFIIYYFLLNGSGLLLRSFNKEIIKILGILVLITPLFLVLLFLKKKLSIYEVCVLRKSKIWWFCGGVGILYGLLISSIYGWEMYDTFSKAFYLVPLILLTPFSAFIFQNKNQWLKLLFFQSIIGFVSAFIDLLNIYNQTIHFSIEKRFHSENFYNISFIYSFLMVLLLFFLLRLNLIYKFILLLFSLFLNLRIIFSISRGFLLLIIIVLIYVFILKLNSNTKILKCKSFFYSWIKVLTLSIIFILLLKLNFIYKYFLLYKNRMYFFKDSIEYRIEEIKSAIYYGNFLGEGWGAKRDFYEALQFTHNPEALIYKGYVHNLVGFLYWKIGIVGLIILFLFCFFIKKQCLINFKNKDILGHIFWCLIFCWFVHSMFNMVFSRIDINIWCASWLGYFFYRDAQIKTTKNNFVKK
ncbi:MAG: hypothetical protein LWW95_10460 [Candidatus Desulfofervidus auxilii]|nr:hypothetical protein [Candidatus Desulfofervidus auxilii]